MSSLSSEVFVASTTDDVESVQAAAAATNAELEGSAMPAPVEPMPAANDAESAESRPEETAEAQGGESHHTARRAEGESPVPAR